MRPIPGAARMYPETDIPAQLITDQFVEREYSHLPEPADKKLARLIKQARFKRKISQTTHRFRIHPAL